MIPATFETFFDNFYPFSGAGLLKLIFKKVPFVSETILLPNFNILTSDSEPWNYD